MDIMIPWCAVYMAKFGMCYLSHTGNTKARRGEMTCGTLQPDLLSEHHILFSFCTPIFTATLPQQETTKIPIHLQENG